MRSIIVPVDFSADSVNAAYYALEFARKIKASLILLYVYQYPVPFSEVPFPTETVNEVIEDAGKSMVELKELLRGSAEGVKIYSEIREGYLISEISNYCKSVHPYAIVMGTHGAGAMERELFGSNTIAAMKYLTWPLIIVPKGKKFSDIKSIGLACDLKNITKTVHADKIKKMVTDFNAKLHIVHVNTDKNKIISSEKIEGSEWLRDLLADVQPEFHFLYNENVNEGVNAFVEKNKPDLLILIPKKHNLLENIIHRSQTKQTALHTNIPIVTIHE